MSKEGIIDIYQYRPLLISMAYRILGEVQEAEDVVQDCFEAWLARTPGVIHPKAYLVKVTVNRAIDRLKELKKARELYKGTWLPVPILTEPSPLAWQEGKTDELAFGILYTLEKLNPIERAVFILRETFDYDYQEIAEICNHTPENCRQLFHRSKEKLQLPKNKFVADPQKHRQLLEAFLQACQEENAEKLAQLLKEDIVLYSDGGGKMAAALNPLFGTSPIIKFFFSILRKSPDWDLQIIEVNTLPGVLAFNKDTGLADTVFTLEVENDQIGKLFLVRNPDKIFLRK